MAKLGLWPGLRSQPQSMFLPQHLCRPRVDVGDRMPRLIPALKMLPGSCLNPTSQTLSAPGKTGYGGLGQEEIGQRGAWRCTSQGESFLLLPPEHSQHRGVVAQVGAGARLESGQGLAV